MWSNLSDLRSSFCSPGSSGGSLFCKAKSEWHKKHTGRRKRNKPREKGGEKILCLFTVLVVIKRGGATSIGWSLSKRAGKGGRERRRKKKGKKQLLLGLNKLPLSLSAGGKKKEEGQVWVETTSKEGCMTRGTFSLRTRIALRFLFFPSK